MNHFLVIVPVYNAVQWIDQCLNSILIQRYDNFDVVVIDDHSTDGTWDKILKYDFNIVRNKSRNGSGLQNIKKGIDCFNPNPDTIIVTVDGDDMLSNQMGLSYLNEIYTEDVWLTYGQYAPASGRYSGICQPLEYNVTFDDQGEKVYSRLTPQTYRQSGVWVTSHLRTFRTWLWRKIKDEDLRDKDGKYFRVAWDFAFMYPMIEMAGSHIRFIDKVLYFYNDLNPACDGTINPKLQIETGKYIQSKPIYKEL